VQHMEFWEFRDPIHGFIKVWPHERAIIDTPEFQRLRRIRQLGLTSQVYHGAEHSRFGHALGVMHLAGEAVQRVVDGNRDLVRERLGWGPNCVEEGTRRLVLLARLAALLHDVGHGPFSHTGEKRLFPEGTDHQDYGAAIVRAATIGDIIDSSLAPEGITREEVAQLIVGTWVNPAGFVQELISSPWDVDKMDYLLRDSLYCGVEYGRFDLRRLVACLTLYGESEGGELELAVEDGGIHALEGLVLARYFLFTQVYFHSVRRSYDLVLTELIEELMKRAYGVPTYPLLSDSAEFLAWDDARVLAEARTLADANLRNPAWRIIQRRHPRVVYQTTPHEDAVVALRAYTNLYRAVAANFGDIRFWPDRASDHPESFRLEDIPIKQAGTPPRWRSFVGISRALSGLEEIRLVRIYADVADSDPRRPDIEEFCRQFMA
jgi:HD superfamily phosphohydrolase